MKPVNFRKGSFLCPCRLVLPSSAGRLIMFTLHQRTLLSLSKRYSCWCNNIVQKPLPSTPAPKNVDIRIPNRIFHSYYPNTSDDDSSKLSCQHDSWEIQQSATKVILLHFELSYQNVPSNTPLSRPPHHGYPRYFIWTFQCIPPSPTSIQHSTREKWWDMDASYDSRTSPWSALPDLQAS